MPIALNLSPRSLREANLADQLAEGLRRHRANPADLMLEITENVIMADPNHSVSCLGRLHDMGIRLAIDDFGTGYSSLSYLRQLPVDVLKLDRSFIVGLATDDAAIVQSTIDLAHHLGLTIVAEGVESTLIHARLHALGCDGAQGWFIAPPSPAPETRRWVMRYRAA